MSIYKGSAYIAGTNAIGASINLDNLSAAGQAVIDGRVNKLGDTMTGDLMVEKTEPFIILKDPNLDYTSTTAPTDSITQRVSFNDKNGVMCGNVYHQHVPANYMLTGLWSSRNISGTDFNDYFAVGSDSTGSGMVVASTGVKSTITGWACPSNSRNNVTVGASGAVYTAPGNGYYCFVTTNTSTQNNYTYLVNETAKIHTYAMANAGVVAEGFVPVKKGDQVSLGYFNSTIQNFYFIYAVGG